ncbi:MAG TPA: transcription termination/antitermination protein NusG [Elusimicrobiota bacterium]|nr:transcription termination/antitermination protein NusG [Elusimicrobiota bacterium]
MKRGWYIIHTYTGHEDKVKKTLEKQVALQSLSSRVFQILIPTEDVVELRRNKKQVRKRKFFPGYVLVDMDLDNETYWIIRNTPGVTGFLGGVQPTPLPDSDVQHLLALATAPADSKPRPAVVFEKGENVRINDGPFKHFIGTVEEVHEDQAKLKVMVSIFGRATPLKLDYLQVEKL